MKDARMRGVRIVDAADAVITAKVPRRLAERLRDEARENYSTVSGQIRKLLIERFEGA